MRTLFGCIAVLLGAVSIALAARYGYKGADTMVDGVISAVVFGAIALCAFLFDAAAVRLWFMGHRIGSVVVGLIAAAALIVTFTNNLGAIAGRADAVQAQRQSVTDTRADNRRELKRLEATLASLGTFTPADGAAVRAAKRAVNAAATSKRLECDRRGLLCKQWERDEAAAAAKLATITAAKATTDRANKLEADIAAIRVRLGGAPAVQNANPLGAALELMLGAGAAVLTAWQQAIVAGVFELCLVGVMVIFELLGQQGQPTTRQAGATNVASARTPDKILDAVASAPARPALPSPRRSRVKASTTGMAGSVKSFVRDHMFPADASERIDLKSMIGTYRDWCVDKGLAPADLNTFLDEVEELCRKLGVKIEMGDDQRVYCHGVRIEASSPARVH